MTRPKSRQTGQRRGDRTAPPTNAWRPGEVQAGSAIVAARRAHLTPAEREDADRRVIEAREILRCASPEAAAAVVALALDDGHPGDEKQGIPARPPAPPAVRLAAAQIILDRALGRPTQAIEVSGGGPNAVIASVLARRVSREGQQTIDVTPTRGDQ